MSSTDDILKSFGFEIDNTVIESKIPEACIIQITSGTEYKFNTETIRNISAMVNNFFNSENVGCINSENDNGSFIFHKIVDEKYMEFLVDFCDYVKKNKLPIFVKESIRQATTLENAIGKELYKLFEKHFNYKFIRSDCAVKEYLDTFDHFLNCSNFIVSDILIELFAIAISQIIRHLPSAEYILTDA